MGGSINRREFLGAGAAGAGAMFLSGHLGSRAAMAGEGGQWPPKMPPVKIHKVYIGRTGGIYLSRPKEEIGKFEEYLAKLERKLGDVKFVGGEVVPPVKVDEVLKKLNNADGVILFHLSGHGGGAPKQTMDRIINVGLQTAVFSQPFSGHGWMYFPQWRKAGKKVVVLPTSNWGELEKIVRLMRVGPHLKKSRIIVVRGPLGTAAACSAEQVKKKLGVEMVPITVEETIKAHQAVDIKDAEAEAQQYWISKAKKIVEPSRKEIINSARLYLAMKNIMIKERAQATTSSNCMGGPAKGCLTYSKLNDLGLVGACEGDMDSTLTMLMFAYAFGIPGFISDPVIDTSSNALIHFHCTSATKMDGPGGKRLPFTIRTQSDSERGVSLEVDNRIGQVVTCAKFINLDTMLISTGKIFKVTRDELGCRTQFWTEVPNAQKMFHNWGAGILKGGTMALLHRDVFYGDYMQDIRNLGVLMGFNIVEEGGPASQA
ncbi:MAG TPA: twin-arginine translocation signal domain-containing protein [Planctomycetes bacterium]|nr:twin-arginine translocation signal domain-containing protein [Planctomycetota bacterium]